MKYKIFLLSLLTAIAFLNMPVFGEEIAANQGGEITVQEKVVEQPTQQNTALTREQIVQNILDKTPIQQISTYDAPEYNEDITENDLASIRQQNYRFKNGDFFWMRRYDFKTTTDGYYYAGFTIPGNSIEIRYVDPETKEWVLTSDIALASTKKTTLFVNTDSNTAIISVPAVYKENAVNGILVPLEDKETPISIVKNENNYAFNFKFPQDSASVGQFWCLQSPGSLIDWTSQDMYNGFKTHDLAFERRWAYDGYYFIAPSNYQPYTKGMLYRHPSNYTGASWARYGSAQAFEDLGYVMMKVCMRNQNAEGFWATGPVSEWLMTDFNIGSGFYDTRFNTDFATSLVYSYRRYNDYEFLKAAVIYAEYFIEHATKNHYDVNGGWLVQDYAPSKEQDIAAKPTHVSLNHQLAEINFLYELYYSTKEQKYYDLAELMLLGIENTKSTWILPSYNLNYAYNYTGTANTMVDYPYLTYNDLFITKSLLQNYFGRTNETIEELMRCKKIWMDNNNVTGYMKVY